MKEFRFDSLFAYCPGAELGNCPKNGHTGNISILPDQIIPALEFMRRKRVNIVGLFSAKIGGTDYVIIEIL